ncbi:MAG: helix-hairpin-helix domain-containing protein [Phototrophicaceae bacterium]
MENNQSSPLTTVIITVILVVGVITAGIFVYFSRPEPTLITINPPLPTSTSAPTSTPEPITVYITGAVNQPQSTLLVPFGSRVQDVIDVAGGLTDDANLDLINLAGIVRDGDQIDVPSLSDLTDNQQAVALPTASGGGVIFINSATLEELQTLPGIGEATAQSIIDYRTENGAFASLEDLDNVSGIGPSTLENLADLIAFD